MATSRNTALNRRFVMTQFIAVPVVAIILISVLRPDPVVGKALADILVAYLAWRVATEQRETRGGSAPAGK